MRFSVAFQVYSTMYVEVEADSEEEAANKANENVSAPCLCWQCSKELEIDDVGDVVNVEPME